MAGIKSMLLGTREFRPFFFKRSTDKDVAI